MSFLRLFGLEVLFPSSFLSPWLAVLRLIECGGEGDLLGAILLSGWDDDSGEPPVSTSDLYLVWSNNSKPL